MFAFETGFTPISTLNLAILEELPASSTHLLTVTANASGLSDLANAISGTVLWYSVLQNAHAYGSSKWTLVLMFSLLFRGRIRSIFAIRL